MQEGLLTQSQVLEILERQQAVRSGYTPFGQIGVELGLLTSGDVAALLAEQRSCRPSLTSILAQRSGLSQEWLESAATFLSMTSVMFTARFGSRPCVIQTQSTACGSCPSASSSTWA